jgi:predicted SnoaL-like aldol condensation-catalyzing enzyme
MLLSGLFIAIAAVAALPNACAAPGKQPSKQPKSYCPSQRNIDHAERLQLFEAFTTELFSATKNGSAVAATFAKYVSPSLIEHTAASSNYGSDVGFLSLLFPTVTVSLISGLQGCFKSVSNEDICTAHYKAEPDNAQSFISNTTVISDFYRYDGTCIVEHWDSSQTANSQTTNPNFPG